MVKKMGILMGLALAIWSAHTGYAQSFDDNQAIDQQAVDQILGNQELLDFSTPPPPVHAVDSAIAKLKPYRTYYQLDAISPYVEQFTARFYIKSVPTIATIRGNTVDEIRSLTKLTAASGNAAIPTLKAVAAPIEARDLEKAARAKIVQLYPTATKIVTMYQGPVRQLDVSETIVVSSANANIFKRIAEIARFRFIQPQNQGTLSLDRSASRTSMLSILCSQWDTQSCTKRPNFIPFAASRGVDGRSLFSYSQLRNSDVPTMFRLKNANFDKDLDRLWPMILRTAVELDSGIYHNPIESILQNQFGGVPSELEIFLNQSITCAGAPEGASRSKETTHTVSFGFTLDQIIKGIKLTETMTEFDIEAKFRATDKELHVTLRHPSGERIEFGWEYNLENNLISGNGSLAPKNGAIRMSALDTGNDESNWKVFPGKHPEMTFRCWASQNDALLIRPAGVPLGSISY